MDYVFNSRILEAEMIKKDISRMDLAKALGCSYTTINARFNNLNGWEYKECLLIRDTFFPHLPIDELFVHNKEPSSA